MPKKEIAREKNPTPLVPSILHPLHTITTTTIILCIAPYRPRLSLSLLPPASSKDPSCIYLLHHRHRLLPSPGWAGTPLAHPSRRLPSPSSLSCNGHSETSTALARTSSARPPMNSSSRPAAPPLGSGAGRRSRSTRRVRKRGRGAMVEVEV